jgi:hypothetical protein
VLTSARLRSIKASRSLITELATSGDPSGRNLPPRIPSRKIRFQIEAISRTVGGWNIPGGWSEGMGLVRTASGQVFKVCASPAVEEETGPSVEGGAVGISEARARPEPGEESEIMDSQLVDSLRATAEVNHWRCSGFPLYGQVSLFTQVTVYSAIYQKARKGLFSTVPWFIRILQI